MTGRTKALAMGIALLVITPTTASADESPSGPVIEHVIVIVEQNHTFDSYFGTYPGANGLPAGTTTINYDDFDSGPGQNTLSNGRLTALDAHRSGAMDGFVSAQDERGFNSSVALVTRDRESAPVLWGLADDYVLFDNYFSSTFGGSLANTLHLFTGDNHGITADSKESLAKLRTLEAPTVFDRLTDANEDWKLYVGRLDEIDPEAVIAGEYERSSVATPSALYWAPALGMPRFWTDPELRSGLADQESFYRDAATGSLPAVSVIIPQPTDHPAGAGEQGQTRLQSLINAATKSPNWESTAVFVVWDDWGGFQDHVAPPTGLGFRVPLLLVSPYSRLGHVSSVELDHTSVLNFIVDRFELEPLSARQQASNEFDDAFTDQPRDDRLLATNVLLDPTPVGTLRQNQTTAVLYLVAFGLGTIGLLVLWRRPLPLLTGEPT